jgi:predicted permease
VTFHPDQVLLATLDLGSGGYDAGRGGFFYSELLAHLRTLPVVRDAALVFVVPLGGRRGGTNIVPEGQTVPVQVGFNIVTPGYFRTIGIPVVRGRDLADSDRGGTAPVAVINDEMARRLYPGRDPVGERFLLKWPPAAQVEIVGIVKDGKFRDYRSGFEPTVYVPLAQRYNMSMTLEVRAAGNPAAAAASIRREVAALDKDLPLLNVGTLKAHFDNVLSQERLSAFLLTSLGALALVLAAIGIYGVLAYSVARRTREIGIRMALGAEARVVIVDMLGGILRLTGIGVGIGLVAALLLGRLIRAMLYGISPADPFVLVAAVVVLVAAALIAGFIPARRASMINPVSALRHE